MDTMNKTELLEAIRTERAALDAATSNTQPPMKDMLSHISLWEGICARWLEAVAGRETPDRPEVLNVDATNAAGSEAAKHATLADVTATALHTHQSILDAIAALSEADLADEQRFGWPTSRMILSNTAEHYAEHRMELTTVN